MNRVLSFTSSPTNISNMHNFCEKRNFAYKFEARRGRMLNAKNASKRFLAGLDFLLRFDDVELLVAFFTSLFLI